MRARLKDVAWKRDGQEVTLVYDVRARFAIADPDGAVEALLELLREGGRTVPELATEFEARGRPVPVEDIETAVGLLDAYGLLEDDARLGQFDGASQERYFSNLAFFASFANLSRSRDDFQQTLRDSHVLVLGTGGLNSNTIPHLCGLGIGRLTLLDQDVVESRNFARQYLYRHSDIGARKVRVAADWVRAFDPAITVEAVDASIQSTEEVIALLDRFAPDVVMSGVDSPNGIDGWVNAGCVSRRVPFVRGGMRVTQGVVWSVEPGVSGCRSCALAASSASAPADADLAEELSALSLFAAKPRENRGIGPVAGLLGSLAAFEVLRYLTRFDPPAYAGRPIVVDFAEGCTVSRPATWERHPSCPDCHSIVDHP